MFFDLNVPLPEPTALILSSSKKGKQKQQQQQQQGNATSVGSSEPPLVFSSAQVAAIEARIDILVHLGYAVLALNQTVQGKIDSRTHVDWLQGLVPKLKRRKGVVVLRRLTVVLDEESERDSGLNTQNAALLSHYDILSLRPTSQASLSLACLTHTVPSPQTAHIISIPVTYPPRLPFLLRHTLVRAALKNGAVFEIDYAGAVGTESERRSWWGGARELVRVTKGKGILLSGGANEDREVRAARDAANLVTLLGIPQNLSHDAVTQTPKSVVLRAQSRKTYRAILSEPKLVITSKVVQPLELLEVKKPETTVEALSTPTLGESSIGTQPRSSTLSSLTSEGVTLNAYNAATTSQLQPEQQTPSRIKKKRQREEKERSGGEQPRKKKK